MSSPGSLKDTPPASKPVGIARSPRQDELQALDTEAQAQATLAAYLNPSGVSPPPNIPPRIASFSSARQGQLSSSPALGGGLSSSARSGNSAFPDALERGRTGNFGDLDALTDEERARVLRRHLVSREERVDSASRRDSTTAEMAGGSRPDMKAISDALGGSDRGSPGPFDETDEFPVDFTVPGADATHGIYKWEATRQREALKRARTTSLMTRNVTIDPRIDYHAPNAFRRAYVLQKSDQADTPPPPMVDSFIDFLYLFGHFGGEELEEDDDDDDGESSDDAPEPDAGILAPSSSRSLAEAGLRNLKAGRLSDAAGIAITDPEQRPLLNRSATTARSQSRRRKRSGSLSDGAVGDASVTQAVLMLLKSFIGTGILFLGKAFFNGGILFSAITLSFIALISLYSFVLLVHTKFAVSGSFGDLGGKLYGQWMRIAILSSIVISQLGFVSAYTIFIASNLQAFTLAVTNCKTFVPIQYLIFVQAIVLLPLSLVRNLAKLSGTALVADAFILIGLIYIGSNEVAQISNKGIADVALFNPKDFPLLIGTSVFSFEGIGLVIPITDAMREPRKFPAVLSAVMIFLMFLFCGAGVLSYAAYGSDVQTVILVNLPQDQKFVQVVQFLYASAILLSVPLQLFPAVRIMENMFFNKSGKKNLRIKWEKNAFRAFTVFCCYCVAWGGAKDLDKFVSFIGSFACIPLCYVYPAMLHYRACARTRAAKIKDITLMVFGLAVAVFTTVQTLKLMLEPRGAEPEFGRCSPAGPEDTPPLRLILSYLGLN